MGVWSLPRAVVVESPGDSTKFPPELVESGGGDTGCHSQRPGVALPFSLPVLIS
jgi:hypothetical protein